MRHQVSVPYRRIYISNWPKEFERVSGQSFRPLTGNLYFKSSPAHPCLPAPSRTSLRGKKIETSFPYPHARQNTSKPSIYAARGKTIKIQACSAPFAYSVPDNGYTSKYAEIPPIWYHESVYVSPERLSL